MAHALVTDGVPVELDYFKHFVTGGYSYPPTVFTSGDWNLTKLAEIGVYPIHDEPIPAGKVAVSSSLTFDGQRVARTFDLEDEPLRLIDEEDVIAERERRLSLGFDYDFGDSRGVHRIGTAANDMRKWLDEVTPIAQALINAEVPTGEIGIFTDTGPVTVTAAEWQQILLAAGNWRQPIYHASFALQAMDPIPADFAGDVWWP